MEEVKEKKETKKKDEENEASEFGVTLLFVVLAVVIGFTVLMFVKF